MEHDNKKLNEIYEKVSDLIFKNDDTSFVKDGLKEYEKYIVQQERKRIMYILNKNMNAKNGYNMTYRELVEVINDERRLI